jgi:membrane protein YdbS with pleckstrin-like domain
MFSDYFSQNLKEGEKMIVVARKHWASFILPIFKTFLILIIPFFFSFFLFSSLFGVIIFFIWMSFGFAYGLYQWLCWYFDSFVITNKRIININQKRLFARSVFEANLVHVQDVTYEINGILASIFNYGTVRVQTAAASSSFEIPSVEKPKEVQELIMDLHHKAKNTLTAQELVEFLQETKSTFIKKDI